MTPVRLASAGQAMKSQCWYLQNKIQLVQLNVKYIEFLGKAVSENSGDILLYHALINALQKFIFLFGRNDNLRFVFQNHISPICFNHFFNFT